MESEDECDGLYMLQNKKICASKFMCSDTYYLSMYTFDDGNVRLCLTDEECVSRKAFMLYSFAWNCHICMTGV